MVCNTFSAIRAQLFLLSVKVSIDDLVSQFTFSIAVFCCQLLEWIL